MDYYSSRSNFKVKSKQAISMGIAPDGGLFVPDKFPKLSLEKIISFNNYKEFAYYILEKYLDDFTKDEIAYCIENAYNNEKFNHDVVNQKKLNSSEFALELWHGPTYAFKDVALQILPYFLLISIKEYRNHKVLILVATSGDTGKAALEGFKDVDNTKIIVFYPSEGVSEVQKRQMTTQEGSNTFVAGIKGNFDDAQSAVKEIFTDAEFSKIVNNYGYYWSSANSINWGRLIPQVIYYVYSYAKLVKENEISLGDKVNFVVPTGNFGNVLAGYISKVMGLPVNKFIIASNKNAVIADFIKTGIYDRRRNFYKTISPSMDILIASNIERLIYMVLSHDSEKTKYYMDKLRKEGYFEVDQKTKSAIQEDFWADYADDNETINEINKVYSEFGYLCDPHSAVGFNIYNKYVSQTKDRTKTILLQTASPFKFAYHVLNALGNYKDIDHFEAINMLSNITKNPIPSGIKDIDKKKVLHSHIIDKLSMRNFILDKIKL